MITINASKKAAIEAKRDQVLERNGEALDNRQKKTAKDEAAALAKSGDYEAAFNKILELI